MASCFILFVTIFFFSSPVIAEVILNNTGIYPDSNFVLWYDNNKPPTQSDTIGNPAPSVAFTTSTTGSSNGYKISNVISDFIFETDVMFTDSYACEGFYLSFRSVDSNNYYYLKFSGRYDGGVILMGSQNNGNPVNFAYITNQGWSANTWYRIKLVAQGSSLKAYVNDVLKIDVNDATYTSGTTGFSLGFYMPSETVSWYLDNIKLLTIESKIAFASNRDGNYEIYEMNSDGTSQTRLTNNSANDSGPVWSPDGSKIIFESDRDGNYEIYVMNADGANQTRLTNNSASDSQPVWSPNGDKIAFRTNRDGNDEIYVMNTDGTNPVNLTNNFTPYGSGYYYNDFDGEPRWSPDGSKIVFSSWRSGVAGIWVMNADGTNPVQLTDNWTGQPSWSPDGTKIAYSGYGNIFVMNADGSNQHSILNVGCCISPYVGSWSPDGSKMVIYSDRFDGNFEIYTINSDGTNRINISNNMAADMSPFWSPVLNPPPQSAIEHVVLIIVDGLRNDILYSVLDGYQGDICPNLREYFRIKPNIRIENVFSTFPTVTLSANASLITGTYPKEHGIPGNIWMDRYELQHTGSKEMAERYYTDPVKDILTGEVNIFDLDTVKVYTEGLATKDLKVKTIYDFASQKGLTSGIVHHMYSTCGRQNEQNPDTPSGPGPTCDPVNDKDPNISWLPPSFTPDIDFWLYVRDPGKYDRNMAYKTAYSILDGGLPNILTLYFAGHDKNSHENGILDQIRYLKDLIDPLFGILINGGTLYRYGGFGDVEDEMYFPGLKNLPGINFDKTVFIITADHGQHQVNKKIERINSEILHALTKEECPLLSTSRAICMAELQKRFFVALNGGMTQIYVKNKKTNSWADYPDMINDLVPIRNLLVKNSYALCVESILTRDSNTIQNWTTNYVGYIPPEYRDAANRLLNLASDRSGDIIILPKSHCEYDSSKHRANHGSLDDSDSLIPLIFSGGPFEISKTITFTRSIVDIAPSIATLLNFQMDGIDGSPIEEVINAVVK